MVPTRTGTDRRSIWIDSKSRDSRGLGGRNRIDLNPPGLIYRTSRAVFTTCESGSATRHLAENPPTYTPNPIDLGSGSVLGLPGTAFKVIFFQFCEDGPLKVRF